MDDQTLKPRGREMEREYMAEGIKEGEDDM
jgi:hypothetical protein